MTPTQQAAESLKQQLGGKAANPTPPKQNALDKLGNAGSNIANGIFNAVTGPFQKVIGSGVRALQDIPNVLQAKSDGKGGVSTPGYTQETPFTSPTGFKSQTLQGSTIPQNLGTAAQAASFLAPGTGLAKYGVTGALQGAGTELQNPDTTPGRVAGAAVLGGATDIGVQQGLNAVQNAASHPIFSRSTPIMNPYDVQAATAARESASQGGVNAINEMNQTVKADQAALGNEFQQGAQKLEVANPNTKLALSSKTLESLNNLRESKNFALPPSLDQEANPLLGQNMSPDFLARNAGKISALENADKVALTPTDAQDLITRLNKLTFASKASGDLAVNQQTIGLTNEIKQAASKTFGPEWDQLYSDFAQGRTAMEKLDGIVNLDPKASPMDFNKQLQTITKLGETPEGEKFLQQAIDQYKTERGIDLTDPVAAVNKILKAQGQLEIAQKGSYATQLKQALKSPSLAARRIAAIGITLLGLTAAGTAFRKQIGGFIAGQ